MIFPEEDPKPRKRRMVEIIQGVGSGPIIKSFSRQR